MAQIPKTILATVDGRGITAPDLDVAISSAIRAAKAAIPFTVFTLNLDHLVKLRGNARFAEAYRNADIVTADGAPVAWLARLQDPTITRTTGADMLVPLLKAAAEARIPAYLFGSSNEVLTEATRELNERTGGALRIVGARAPSADFDPEGPEADLAINSIAASGARLCIVALGAPKQEVFADRARAKGLACGMICTGAALDFVAGAQIRAPQGLRNSGLEWAWRLATNPRRFAKRYADCAMVLVDLVLLTPLRERFAKARPQLPR